MPGGHLGLLWNSAVSDWDRAAMRVAHPGLDPATGEARAERSRDLPGLELVGHEAVHWTEQLSREDYLRRQLTVSRFLAAEPARRAEMLAEVEQLLDQSPETAGATVLQVGHRTEVFVYRS